MWRIPLGGEDAYWVRCREERENSELFKRKSLWNEEEPEYEIGTVFLDEEIEEIEKKRGFPMKELYEGDLLEILEELKGIIAENASWDETFDAIDYTVRAG